MAFEAKYHGTCGSCQEKITPGQQVKYVDEALVHDDCEAEAPREKATGVVCTTCFMEKSLSGACGCTL